GMDFRAARARSQAHSDKGEGPPVVFPIYAGVDPFHEPEGGNSNSEAVALVICPATPALGVPDLAEEIGNVRRLADLVGKTNVLMDGKWGDARAQQIRRQRTRDGLRQDTVILGPRLQR